MEGSVIFFMIVFFVGVGAIEFFIFLKNKKLKENLIKTEEAIKYKIYETSILNALSEKIGYSLGVQNMAEIIIKYLDEIIDYDTVSYIIPLPSKIVFRIYVKNPVYRRFINDMKEKMLNFSASFLKSDFKNLEAEEAIWGNILDGELEEGVGSFFCVPLKIGEKIEGFLCAATRKVNFYKEKEMNIVNNIVEQATQAIAKLQEVIESEKSKLNAMVASMADGVVMIDMDYKIIVANPAARRVLNVEEKKDLLLSELVERLKEKIDLKDKIEESIRLEKVFVSEEISLSGGFFHIIISPVKDRWKMLGCVAVFRDITREKEVARMKESFTSMIVHELRSPLDSIKKMIELMRTSKIKKTEQEKYFQMMYSSSSDMLELINNLLNIAKIEADKFEIIKQPSDIKKIIESRISFFDIAAKDAKIKLTSQFGDDIPTDISFDPGTISQVLNNLISNAIKFNKEGGEIVVQALFHKKERNFLEEAEKAGIKWFIKEEIKSLPDCLFVAVTDTGPGIPKDQIDKLFSKFSQVKTIFVKKEGSGLGLAIVKSIVESHGGIAGVASEEGRGATFYFTIPLS